MKTINLTQGQVALVDDEDYEWLSQHKWYARWSRHTSSFYALRGVLKNEGERGKSIYMVREILGFKQGDNHQSDHRNHNTLDNQRHNLRGCTHQQNMQNRRKHRTWAGKKCSSEYIGVFWCKVGKIWKSQITFNNKRFYLGRFQSEIKAAKIYDIKAQELFGEYANLNF